MAGAFASAMLFVVPAMAQDSRLSLADRVSRLEQQAQNQDQGGVSMVNQVQQLQAQVQQLQGQIEEMQHQLQEFQDRSKAQYVDVDSRLARLESGGANAAAGTNAQAPAAANNAAATPSATNAAPVAGAAGAAAAGAATKGGKNAAPANAAPAGDAATAQAAYDTAFKALRAGDYAQSSREFRDFIQKYPDSPLTPNAFYWLGESYYVTMNYGVAVEAFQVLLNKYPSSDKAPDALLKVGYAQLELKKPAEGKATLKQVTTKYPGSKAASLAQERLRRLQMQPAN